MSTWVTHLMVADAVLERLPYLRRHEFCVGNIAPDCNIENEDWTSFTPSREVTHWMSDEKKSSADSERFLREYVERKKDLDSKEESFLLGYYAHLVTDAEFLRVLHEEERVRAIWKRIKQHPELSMLAVGMDETLASVNRLIPKRERMQDIYSWEAEYLEFHPESGYFTEIINLKKFPDYLEYLPEGAIVRKVQFMGYLNEKKTGSYSNIAISKEEFDCFVKRAIELVEEGIERYKRYKR